MTDHFKQYTSIVQKVLRKYNNELAAVFTDRNIEEVFIEHDNWNGGIDFYNLTVNIPINLYYQLKEQSKVEEADKRIFDIYSDIMRGEDGSLVLREVNLRPSDNCEEAYSNMNDDSMWKSGYYRLFISHLTEDKKIASELKKALLSYGIDGFVAHEDIKPSKEWELEMEKALFSMDALCAIITPNFNRSQWCDQEVGIAIGRQKMVFAIDKGAVPYGFFGKYQAIKNKGKSPNEMAKAMCDSIADNEKTQELYLSKFIALILNVKSIDSACGYASKLKEMHNVTVKHIIQLHENYVKNQFLMNKSCLNVYNSIFMNYGLSEIVYSKSSPQLLTLTESDLPF